MMKKRLISVLLVLATIAAILAGPVSAATNAENSTQDGIYQVGYSKVDTNPYYDENDHSKGLMPLPMGGNGFETQRLGIEEKLDDNGDGLVGEGDGLFSTCVAVTDPAGQTALFFSVDLIAAPNATIISDPVRKALCAAYPGLSADRIIFTGSHTHSGPKVTASYMNNEVFGEYVTLYVERMVANLTRAGHEAMADRAPAKLYKGSIEASQSQAATQPIGDTLNAQQKGGESITVLPGEEDRLYNTVRHYVVTEQLAKRTRSEVIDFSKYHPFAYTYEKTADGKYIADPDAPKSQYVCGSNFNSYVTNGRSRAEVYFVYADGSVAEGLTEANTPPVMENGRKYFYDANGIQVYWVADVYVATMEHVSKADDTMHVVEFRFEDSTKKPIAMVNWRAHTTMNRMVSDDFEELKEQGKYQDLGFYTSYYQYSGDWVNAMRYTLEQGGYRPAFIQGAAGNITGGSKTDDLTWTSYETETDRSHARNVGNIYGSEIAEVALELLGSDAMKRVNAEGGELRSIQRIFQTERQTVPEGLYAAAQIYAAEFVPAHPTGLWSYTHTDGQVYKITSIHHANSVINRYSSNDNAGTKLQLNAIMIGKELAFVTAPNELFDRYSSVATIETANDYNDWEKLNSPDYGEPIVVGYANNSNSYLPNALSYDYTKDNPKWASGCYETLTSAYAKGNGEAVIAEFDWMLEYLQEDAVQQPTTREGYCDHCKTDVTWTALSEANGKSSSLYSGHYYLDSQTNQLSMDIKNIQVGEKVCLDLNGKTLIGNVQVFTVADGATLSIMGEGTVMGSSGAQTGGTVEVNAGGTLNLYSGTLAYNLTGEEGEILPMTGGVVHNQGIFNMYDGVVQGTKVSNAAGAIYSGNTGTLNLMGGRILSGNTSKPGPCIYARGYVNIAKDCYVQQLYLNPITGGPALSEMLTFNGKFTGYVDIQPSRTSGTDIGTNDNTDLFDAVVKVGGRTNLIPTPVGEDLILMAPAPALVEAKSGTRTGYQTLQGAIDAFTGTDVRVVLRADNAENVAVTGDAVLDLNGYDLTGKISGTGTLTVRDSQTDDYDAENGNGYGVITGSHANVVPAENYVKITEDNGTSFHKIDLTIKSMGLRPENAGLYFKSDFAGDQVVARNVSSFGVALSVTGEPDESTLENPLHFTRYEKEAFGTGADNTSTLLTGILKEDNGYNTNVRNSKIQVYGRAYIEIDGEYIFGATRHRSMQEQLEGIDEKWSKLGDTQKTGILDLYTRFKMVMRTWTLPNLKAELN